MYIHACVCVQEVHIYNGSSTEASNKADSAHLYETLNVNRTNSNRRSSPTTASYPEHPDMPKDVVRLTVHKCMRIFESNDELHEVFRKMKLSRVD